MLLWATFDQDSVIVRVKILDSTVATGAGKTGLAFNTSALVVTTIADSEATSVAYRVADTTIEDITTLGTYAAPTATKCRFKEVSATNHPGLYEVQLANARFAIAGAKSLLISIFGATGAAQCDAVIPLPTVDLFTAITYPANFAALSIDGSGRTDVIKVAGTTQTARDLGAQLDAAISTRATPTNITAGTITTVTNLTNAPTAGDLTATMKTSVTTAATAATPVAASVTGGATAAAVAALNNLSAAQVNAEMVDTLNVDTYAEPGQEAPGTTVSLARKINYLYKAWRNRHTQTATTYALYADNATTIDQKATVSDDATTFDRNEIATGP